jgi:hypothetical protein
MESEDRIPEPPSWFRWIPLAAIVLSLTILLFQIFILHGWHMKLSNQMRHVKGRVA